MKKYEGNVLYFQKIETAEGEETTIPVFNTGNYRFVPTHEEAAEIIASFRNIDAFSKDEIEEMNGFLYKQSGIEELLEEDNKWLEEYRKKKEEDRKRKAVSYFDYDSKLEEEVLFYAGSIIGCDEGKREKIEDALAGDWYPRFEHSNYVILYFKDDQPVACGVSLRTTIFTNVKKYRDEYGADKIVYLPVPVEISKEVALEVKVSLGIRIKGMNSSMFYTTESQARNAYEDRYGLDLDLDDMNVEPVAFSGIKTAIIPVYRKKDIADELGLSRRLRQEEIE